MNSPKAWVELGRILKEWGIGGELKCLPYNSESELFHQVSRLYVGSEGRYHPRDLESARRHGKFWRLKFRDLDTPEAAKACSGEKLALPREEMPALDPGQIYLADLLQVQVLDSGDRILGRVVEIQQVGDSDVLWIETAEHHRVPVPYEKDFVASTDLKAGQLKLTAMALDLFEMNQS